MGARESLAEEGGARAQLDRFSAGLETLHARFEQQVISGDGKVTSANANKGSGAFKSCVASAVKRAKFKKTQKGMKVSYPFIFR